MQVKFDLVGQETYNDYHRFVYRINAQQPMSKDKIIELFKRRFPGRCKLNGDFIIHDYFD